MNYFHQFNVIFLKTSEKRLLMQFLLKHFYYRQLEITDNHEADSVCCLFIFVMLLYIKNCIISECSQSFFRSGSKKGTKIYFEELTKQPHGGMSHNEQSCFYCLLYRTLFSLSFLFTSKPFLERNSLSYLQRNKKCTRHNRCNKFLKLHC